MLNQIIHGDCLEVMKDIPDGSIDLILTDPPYNISRESNFHTMGRKGVDFGEWDKGFNLTSWLSFACEKLRKGGSIVVFNDWKNMTTFSDFLLAEGFLVKEMLQWKKTNPMPRNRDRLYVTRCEYAIWATKGKGWTFNRQKETYEDGIFEYSLVGKKDRIHPTQKKLELIEDIIRIHSNEGDLVLDPFVGSGTTAIAALKTGRNFIGIEKEKEYVNIANARLREEAQKMVE